MFTMHNGGTFESEEVMRGRCTDGRQIVVELSIFLQAPEDERWDARYWENRWCLGHFDREDASPVWVL